MPALHERQWLCEWRASTDVPVDIVEGSHDEVVVRIGRPTRIEDQRESLQRSVAIPAQLKLEVDGWIASRELG